MKLNHQRISLTLIYTERYGKFSMNLRRYFICNNPLSKLGV